MYSKATEADKADKSKDGWQVVAEYESDDLASGSKDEKRLKKAREAASRKRRQNEQLSGDRGKKPRIALAADNQLFRGKKKSLPLYFVYSYVFWICLYVLPYFSCYLFVLWEFKGKMIYVRLSEAN